MSVGEQYSVFRFIYTYNFMIWFCSAVWFAQGLSYSKLFCIATSKNRNVSIFNQRDWLQIRFLPAMKTTTFWLQFFLSKLHRRVKSDNKIRHVNRPLKWSYENCFCSWKPAKILFYVFPVYFNTFWHQVWDEIFNFNVFEKMTFVI